MPNCAPVSTSASAKCSALSEDDPGGEHEHQADDQSPLELRHAADELGRPDEVRLLGRGAGDADEVRDEQPDEHHRIEERERALQAQGERVDGRDHEERDLDRVRPFEPDLVVERAGLAALSGELAHPPGGEQHHERPADADQEPVAAGHVREGELRVDVRVDAGLGRLAGLRREHEVHGVLGQDRDECQHGEGETGGDVELEHLGGPRQQERRTDDGEAVEDGLDPALRAQTAESDGQSGHRERERRDECEELAPSMWGRLGHPPHPTREAPPLSVVSLRSRNTRRNKAVAPNLTWRSGCS